LSAQTLFSPQIGYKYLDVRAEFELNAVGKVLTSTNIPLINGKKQFVDGAQQVVQTPNPEFLARVAKLFPDKATKIIIGCSDGSNRTIQVC
jgi:hypothetical protein